MRVHHIDDPLDPRVGDYVGLRDPQLRISVEAPGSNDTPNGRFITEGSLALEKLVGSPYPIRSILISDAQAGKLASVLASLPDEVQLLRVTQRVLNEIAGFNLHRGVLASSERLPMASEEQVLGGARRVLVLEGIVDHENLGSIFRSAAAFGVDAVLLDPTCADPLYRRAVRVSLGHVLRMPFTRAVDWPQALDGLKHRGFRTLALSPSGSVAIGEIPKDGAPVALLLGSEGPGLSALALERASLRVRIPIAPGIDSLNVGVAAAVALFALTR